MGSNQSPRVTKIHMSFFEKAASSGLSPYHLSRLDRKLPIYELSRATDKVIIFLTNIYTVGIADYFDIRKNHPSVNCIVTISNWNYYTPEAKKQAIQDHVGLFTFAEFMGAMRVESFWRCVQKRPNE